MEENKTSNTNNQNNNDRKKRTHIIDGTVGEDNMRKAVEFIIDINSYDDSKETREPIKLIINTYGGSLYDANMLIGIIETSETPIYTYCHGKAMSAGFYIFVAGHKRFSTPLATFMYHDGSVGLHNSIEGLQASLNWQVALRDRYDEYILSKTKLPRKIMDESKRIKEDLYMPADEALEYGIVDEILPFRKHNK